MEEVELQEVPPALQHAHDGLQVCGRGKGSQTLDVRRHLFSPTPERLSPIARCSLSKPEHALCIDAITSDIHGRRSLISWEALSLGLPALAQRGLHEL